MDPPCEKDDGHQRDTYGKEQLQGRYACFPVADAVALAAVKVPDAAAEERLCPC